MAPVSIQIMEAIKARLQGITTASGYFTDLGGNFLVGWPQHLLARQTILPLMVMHSSLDNVNQWRGTKALSVREAAVEVIIAPHTTAPIFLDQALFDIRRALVGLDNSLLGVTSLDQGQAVWDEPGEDSALVRLTVPVTFTYVEDYDG